MKRMNSVIISGVEEGDSSLFERQDHDLGKVMEISSEIGNPIVKNDILKLRRVGRLDTTWAPRLLCVTFHNQEKKYSLLRCSKLLRKSKKFLRVYVNPDRTKQQQQEFEKLNKELHDRRARGENVIINKNHVVERIDEQKKHFR